MIHSRVFAGLISNCRQHYKNTLIFIDHIRLLEQMWWFSKFLFSELQRLGIDIPILSPSSMYSDPTALLVSSRAHHRPMESRRLNFLKNAKSTELKCQTALFLSCFFSRIVRITIKTFHWNMYLYWVELATFWRGIMDPPLAWKGRKVSGAERDTNFPPGELISCP